jgi:hypothetical protein
MKTILLALATVLCASSNSASAQVNDQCTSYISLPGPGTYPFDTTNATTGSQHFSACGDLFKDVWFVYTATTTGTATITTCGQIAPASTSENTKLAVHTGVGCPGTMAVACDDDEPCNANPSSQTSTASWATSCGQTYSIRLGNFSASDNILGTFTITETGAACTPTSYCGGTNAFCPCGNGGAAGSGCANSGNASGAKLASTGVNSVSADTLSLVGTGMLPGGPCIYFQGTIQTQLTFGDGLRCVVGSVIRLGTKFNDGTGSSSYPVGADVPIHTKGNVVAGNVRAYQSLYRDAVAFCTSATFNTTNALRVIWAP